ncbi:hypothetical protein IFM61606_01727 [Aspergillus udagawae]|uniref:Uncharacterized protein n=1 Tax=Aspergillus udagawae TaxID=91492 RepID=A0ABQ0ZYY8_9EURO|nr:hypothetical protein IFM53868_00038 [Aspergillus udagawae]GFG15436.1 hypothetical protein IFM5058_07452 [Aspergillus udagawae]GFG21875.1 hypothetical protein IFM61606_01727 [Aspergillus udagawae]
MHFSPLVTVACALALAPTAVVATTAAVAFVTVGSVDTCPRGLAQEVTPGPKVVTTAYTCEKAKISHDMSVSYYDFDIQPLNKETYKCCLKVYDNPACLGAAVIDLPVEGPAEDRCIPEYLFDDEVKYISFQLDCDQPYAKAEPHGKQYDEQGYQQTEHAPKQEAQKGHEQAEHAPKQEAQKGHEEAEHAPKQEAQDDSEQGQQAPEQAPERTAGNPADNLGLGDLTKLLGFR